MKGTLRYAITVFIAGWMFFLGIMVGRGNSPVTFDTRGFQERLATIAREYGKASPAGEKIELQIYDTLDEPVRPGILEGKIRPGKSLLAKKVDGAGVTDPDPVSHIPGKPVEKSLDQRAADPGTLSEPKKGEDLSFGGDPESGDLPVKTARKAATLNRAALARFNPAGKGNFREKTDIKKIEIPEKKSGKTSAQTLGARTEKKGAGNEKFLGGNDLAYTIQVASYKALDDALSQMAILDKQGFSSVRIEKRINETVWHRVRCGSFSTYEDAVGFLEKLKKSGFSGLIMKKEEK